MKHNRKRIRFIFKNPDSYNNAISILLAMNIPFVVVGESMKYISVTNKRFEKYDLDLRLSGMYDNFIGTFNGKY